MKSVIAFDVGHRNIKMKFTNLKLEKAFFNYEIILLT
jgi:hypothetical protein